MVCDVRHCALDSQRVQRLGHRRIARLRESSPAVPRSRDGVQLMLPLDNAGLEMPGTGAFLRLSRRTTGRLIQRRFELR